MNRLLIAPATASSPLTSVAGFRSLSGKCHGRNLPGMKRDYREARGLTRRVALLIGLLLISPIVASQETSVLKAGEASFDAGGVRTTYSHVSGTIIESHFGSTTYSAQLKFTPDGDPGRDVLSIGVLVNTAGPANMQAKAGNGVSYRRGDDTFMHYKGKSRCTMTVFKITKTVVEGVADCPVLHKQHGTETETLAVQQIRFYASAE